MVAQFKLLSRVLGVSGTSTVECLSSKSLRTKTAHHEVRLYDIPPRQEVLQIMQIHAIPVIILHSCKTLPHRQ